MEEIKINYSTGMFMVSESFVDKFIKDANPSFIKLYLYILRHSNSGSSLALEKISEDTGLLKSDVISGIKYWSKHGVLSFEKSDAFTLVNIIDGSPSSNDKAEVKKTESDTTGATELKESNTSGSTVSEKKLPKNSVASSYKSSDVIETVSSNGELKHLFSLIQQMLNKSLSANDYKIIYSFIDYLKLPERVILALFEHCISVGKTSMRYIESVAYSWADRGITDVSEAEKFINETNEKQSILKKYKRKFKLVGRDFSDVEAEYIFDWIYNMKVSEKLIMQAYEKTVLNTGKVSISYMNAIICSETGHSETSEAETANVKKSSFRNYPSSYGISDAEKEMIEKMMAEYNGGVDDSEDTE